MFKLRLNRCNDVSFLSADGQFKPFDENSTLLAAKTNGLFMFHQTNNYHVLTYEASVFNRFAVLIAVQIRGCWRLRFRVVPTTVNGLLVFKLASTMQMQNGRYRLTPEYSLNTALVIGLKSRSDTIKLDFRVHANTDGNIDYVNFNGYVSSAIFQNMVGKGNAHIDDALDGETRKPKRKFDQRLYKNADSMPVLSFAEQRRQNYV